MIPDRCGNVPPHAPGDDSDQVAADRVLHIQGVHHPTRAQHRGAAAPRSPPTAGHHAGAQPPPAASPRRGGRAAPDPGSTGPCPTPGPGPARTGPGRRQARRHGPARPARAAPGPVASSAPLTGSFGVQTSLGLRECDRACSGEPTCRPRSRSTRPRSKPTAPSRKQMAASPAVIPPEYRPTLSSTRWAGTTLSRPGRCCTQGALLSSEGIEGREYCAK